MRRLLNLAWMLLLVAGTLPAAGDTGHPDAGERPVARTIIGLYETSATRDWREHVMHQMAEMPLNHLGLLLEPHDVNDGLPDLAGRTDVRGVLTWFDGAVDDPTAYAGWLRSTLGRGLPITIFGDLGFLDYDAANAPPPGLIEEVLRLLRFRPVEQAYDPLYRTHARLKVSSMVEYERLLPERLAVQAAMRSRDPQAKIYLQAESAAGNGAADLVFTAPRASYVAPGYSHYSVEGSMARAWYLDPFTFFAEAFALKDLPRPDVSTLVGRRIYFSHVDGDGWRNWPRFEPYKSKHRYAVDAVIDRAIEPYPDLPVTLAPIAADLDPEWCGDEAAQAAARRVFALPQVEAASHTYTHPFFWRVFDRGSPPGEPIGPVGCAGSPLGVARAYRKIAFDLDHEISGAARLIERYLPPGKRVELVQWSGDTNPSARVLKAVADAGMLNMNGGDSRFDALFASVSWVPSLGVEVGGQRRVYAVGSNENTYTNLWTSQFWGFGMLRETLERTETPRRLKPINIYYHLYSGERLASLNALIANLDYARAAEIAPIAASTYVRMVAGFYATRFVQQGPDEWRVENRGALQTVRFDEADDKVVDAGRSPGVLGWRHHQGSLYVALDPAAAEPVIALRPTGRGEAAATRPVLAQSRWPVSGLRWDGDGFRFEAGGYGAGDMTWRVPAAGQYEVTTADGLAIAATALPDGTLHLVLPARDFGPGPVEVRHRSIAAEIRSEGDGTRRQ